MKVLLGSVLVAALLIGASPAYSSEAVQWWKCEIDDDATEEQVRAHAADWLKAAKKIEGGENLEAYVYFPVAVNATGEMDLMFIVVAPSFEEWGKFWDNYEDSAAAEAENNDMVVCPNSALWESFKVD